MSVSAAAAFAPLDPVPQPGQPPIEVKLYEVEDPDPIKLAMSVRGDVCILSEKCGGKDKEK